MAFGTGTKKRAGSQHSWWLTVWLRALVVVIVCFAAPGTAELVRQVATVMTDADCCDGACDDGGVGDCDDTCSHHGCCAHPSALPVRAIALPDAPAPPLGGSAALAVQASGASGYRAPPFRPPTA